MKTEHTDPSDIAGNGANSAERPAESAEIRDSQSEMAVPAAESEPEPAAAPEPTPDSEPAKPAETPEAPRGITAGELAKAERRVYLKGRNDGITEALSGPGLWQLAPDDGEGTTPLPDVPILQAMRPSIWDL